jgi:hypothetical protein
MSEVDVAQPHPTPVEREQAAMAAEQGGRSAESTDGAHAQEGEALEGQELLDALRKQLEFYFSVDNLKTDGFLVSRMDAQMCVPLGVIAQFAKVRALTSDEAAIVASVADSAVCSVTPSGIRPNVKSERNTVILREIGSDTLPEKVRELFTGDDMISPKSIRSDVGDTWFVTCDTEEEAMSNILALRSRTFQGKPIKARIKSENMLKSFFPAGAPGAIPTPVPADGALVAVGATNPVASPASNQGGGLAVNPYQQMGMHMPMTSPYGAAGNFGSGMNGSSSGAPPSPYGFHGGQQPMGPSFPPPFMSSGRGKPAMSTGYTPNAAGQGPSAGSGSGSTQNTRYASSPHNHGGGRGQGRGAGTSNSRGGKGDSMRRRDGSSGSGPIGSQNTATNYGGGGGGTSVTPRGSQLHAYEKGVSRPVKPKGKRASGDRDKDKDRDESGSGKGKGKISENNAQQAHLLSAANFPPLSGGAEGGALALGLGKKDGRSVSKHTSQVDGATNALPEQPAVFQTNSGSTDASDLVEDHSPSDSSPVPSIKIQMAAPASVMGGYAAALLKSPAVAPVRSPPSSALATAQDGEVAAAVASGTACSQGGSTVAKGGDDTEEAFSKSNASVPKGVSRGALAAISPTSTSKGLDQPPPRPTRGWEKPKLAPAVSPSAKVRVHTFLDVSPLFPVALLTPRLVFDAPSSRWRFPWILGQP